MVVVHETWVSSTSLKRRFTSSQFLRPAQPSPPSLPTLIPKEMGLNSRVQQEFSGDLVGRQIHFFNQFSLFQDEKSRKLNPSS